MTDIIDQANDVAQAETESAIKAARAQSTQAPVFVGRCLNCGKPTQAPRRWCDVECRDEWQEFGE